MRDNLTLALKAYLKTSFKTMKHILRTTIGSKQVGPSLGNVSVWGPGITEPLGGSSYANRYVVYCSNFYIVRIEF